MATAARSIPTTMRASVLHRPRDLRMETRPVPEPRQHEVLVNVRSVGVCGSDVHYYEHGRIGDFVLSQPLVLGHEAAGQIVAVGEGVPASRVGQRVAIEPGVPCRRCQQCRCGRYNLCPDIRFFATPPVDGAFCEYVAIPSDLAYAVPDSMSFDAAALLEPLSVGIWANRKAGTTAGGSVLIAGAGPIGLVTAQVARAFGATEVVISDINPERLRAAERFGATGTVSAGDSAPMGFDAFIDCSGAHSAIDAGVRAVRPAGTVILVGMGADALALPFGIVQQRELTVTGTFRYANTWPAAIAMVAAGTIDLEGLVTAHHDLSECEIALLKGRAPEHIKAVVTT